ncbi:MAG: ATP-dependent DNA helicase RecG, partial [bacterium]|nr:ATP-dependent DNA helicase RecG [bacterium]
KRKIQKEKALAVNIDVELARKFTASLPYKLTDSQRVAAWRILKDMSMPRPMNRLLEGDVGSGKTVVAALAALMAVNSGLPRREAGLPRREAGGQTAFMAPTEILARQHFETLSGTLAPFNVEIALLTSSEAKFFIFGETQKTSRKNLIKEVKSGLIKIIVGTHSLIQKNVSFKNLALAVIDEHHRFGVLQRASLCTRSNQRESAYIPHLLSMTATPIPRTLALTIYGDLDLSLIKELPPGRKNIITEIIPPARRRQAYEFIRRQVAEGRQVFVICPRIDSVNTRINADQDADQRGYIGVNPVRNNIISNGVNPRNNQRPPASALSASDWRAGKSALLWETKAVKEEYERLKKEIFPDLKIGLLHGRMSAKEKEETMKKFSQNQINILVSTSVVEVGVDIPNATIMMIEGAERFGLAQLYQLRGRVGRDIYQSYCFLFSDSAAGAALKRLEAVKICRSGFELAEMDLKMRGPGDFYGIQQWGLPDLTLASLADIELIEAARAEANKLLDEDPELKKYPLLKAKAAEFKKTIHFE